MDRAESLQQRVLPAIPQKTALKRCSHSGGARIDIELEVNIGDMGADRANTDAEANRNLFAAFAARNGLEDFSLTVGQDFVRRYGRRLRRDVRLEGRTVGQDAGHNLWLDEHIATGGQVHGLKERFAIGILEQVATCSGTEALDHQLIFVI